MDAWDYAMRIHYVHAHSFSVFRFLPDSSSSSTVRYFSRRCLHFNDSILFLFLFAFNFNQNNEIHITSSYPVYTYIYVYGAS